VPSPARVAIVYTHIPHYREAVFRRLLADAQTRYSIYTSRGTLDATIKSYEGAGIDDRSRLIKLGPLVWQTHLWGVVLGRSADVVIFLGNPYIVSTWIYALVGRLFGRKVVLFWTHGWTRGEAGLKRAIRSAFYRLANGLLLYGQRAKEIGARAGLDPDTMFVIYNSLDYEAQQRQRLELAQGGGALADDNPYFVAIGRLVPSLALHLAIEALRLVRERYGVRPRLLVIGDGPERTALADLAHRCDVDVQFLGALYDEGEIAPILAGSRALVSPGKVGLAAMHSLAYGTPVITHGDLDFQMPEAEAIRPGLTGDFFDRDDAGSLAEVLNRWYARPPDSEGRRIAVEDIERSYTPQAQHALIDRAIGHFRRAAA
jgi:glycosyltransferase involved in cell wall biosynthesis